MRVLLYLIGEARVLSMDRRELRALTLGAVRASVAVQARGR